VAHDGVDLLGDELVGLAEDLPPLAVPGDHVAHVQLGQERRADLAGERAGLLEVAVLGAEGDQHAVGLDGRLHRAQVGERRVDRDVDGVEDVLAQQVAELLHRLDRLEVVQVHLPVAADQRLPAGGGHGPEP
jgi:hypothetical protein